MSFALLMAASLTVLRETQLFSVAVERRPASLPLLALKARARGTLDIETAREVLRVSSEFLETSEDFNSFWDIRAASVPPAEVVWACVSWAVKNTSALRKQNKRMAVLVPDSQPLRRIVQLVLKVAAVRCPALVTASEAEALEFVGAGGAR